MFEKPIRDFLVNAKCNPSLFDYIQECKKDMELIRYTAEPIRVEASVKTYKDGTQQSGRYGISIPMNEFHYYIKEKRAQIFRLVGFNMDDFESYITNDRYSTIYFAFDGSKGKVYFGSDTSLKCFEPDGLIKTYSLRNKDNKNWFDVTTNRSDKEIVSIHVRARHNKDVNWYGISKNSVTIYYRPYFKLSPDEFNKLEYVDRLKYRFYRKLYNHACVCDKCLLKPDNDEFDISSIPDFRDIYQKAILELGA